MSSDPLSRRDFVKYSLGATAAAALPFTLGSEADAAPGDKPNIILCMTDDQGWGDTSYNGHKVLKTPELDAMAAAGIRFDRFYAAAPVCSPTRGSCLTGRHPNRYKCYSHGHKLGKKEVTIAQLAKQAGYTTGHFGKWHLNGIRGPGKPISTEDAYGPGKFGFDTWLSVTNYFELDWTFSRNGENVKIPGDGSDAIVGEALKFIGDAAKKKKPFLAVVWYGSPHVPLKALKKDREPYAGAGSKANYFGELAGVDRSMGTLRKGLRNLGIADNTIVWFCSDNGSKEGGTSTGGLRGKKGQLWEGGIRVPGILEWPARVKKPVRTSMPCVTSDFYPTIRELLGVKAEKQPEPLDGISLVPLIDGKMKVRPKPIGFWVHGGRGGGHTALIDNEFKLHLNPAAGKRGKKGKKKDASAPKVLLYNLQEDTKETTDLAAKEAARTEKMKATLLAWQQSVKNSMAGKDYK